VISQIDKTGTISGFAASNARETGKKAEMRAIWRIFCRNPISFALPSPPQTRVS